MLCAGFSACRVDREHGIVNGLTARDDGGLLMSTMVATQPEIALSPAFPPQTEITPEELLAMPDGGHYELVDGELRERKVSACRT